MYCLFYIFGSYFSASIISSFCVPHLSTLFISGVSTTSFSSRKVSRPPIITITIIISLKLRELDLKICNFSGCLRNLLVLCSLLLDELQMGNVGLLSMFH